MEYGPIKQRLGDLFHNSVLKIVFFKLIDWLLLREWYLKRHLLPWAIPNKNKTVHILDAGSGFGQVAYYLGKVSKSWNILGIDINPNLVCESNQFFIHSKMKNVVFRSQDLTEIDEKDVFDLVVCVDVLEEIEDDKKVIENFHHSLKPGGKLILTVPSDHKGLIIKTRSFKLSESSYVRDGYKKEEIEELLKEAGFQRIKVRYTFGLAGQFSLKLGLKWPVSILNRGNFFYFVLPIYYIVFFPIVILLNFLDVFTPHFKGVGLIVKADK